MKRQLQFLLFVATVGSLIAGCSKTTSNPAPASQALKTGGAHEDSEGYYTCPMHPQIHEHKPGSCPICGMPLVKTTKGEQTSNEPSGADAGKEITVLDTQLNLAGIGKHTVARKDLTFTIPVSGRLVSSRDVVFQVFESDLQIIKNGLPFSGSSAAAPDEMLEGKIRSVDTLLDPTSRTIRVIGTLDRVPKRSVHEGSFHGEIKATETGQIAVPEQAVLHTGQGNLVYVISSENRIKPVSVALGKKTKGEFQILSGLSEGDVISTGPNFLVDSEAKIRGSSDQTHH